MDHAFRVEEISPLVAQGSKEQATSPLVVQGTRQQEIGPSLDPGFRVQEIKAPMDPGKMGPTVGCATPGACLERSLLLIAWGILHVLNSPPMIGAG